LENRKTIQRKMRKKEGERALPFEFKGSLENGLRAISEKRSG